MNKYLYYKKLITFLFALIFPNLLVLSRANAGPYRIWNKEIEVLLPKNTPPEVKGNFYVCKGNARGVTKKGLFWRDGLYKEQNFNEKYLYDAHLFVGKKFLSKDEIQTLVNEKFMHKNVKTANQYSLYESIKTYENWLFEDFMLRLNMRNKSKEEIAIMIKNRKIALIDKTNFTRTNHIEYYRHWNDNNKKGINDLETSTYNQYNCTRLKKNATGQYDNFIHERQVTVIKFAIENAYGQYIYAPQSILVLDALIPLSPFPNEGENIDTYL